MSMSMSMSVSVSVSVSVFVFVSVSVSVFVFVFVFVCLSVCVSVCVSCICVCLCVSCWRWASHSEVVSNVCDVFVLADIGSSVFMVGDCIVFVASVFHLCFCLSLVFCQCFVCVRE